MQIRAMYNWFQNYPSCCFHEALCISATIESTPATCAWKWYFESVCVITMTVFEIRKEKLGLVDYVKSFLATFLPNNQDPWNHYTIYAVAIKGICDK